MAAAPLSSRLWSYRDSPAVHLAVGALVCFFVLSPIVFTPWGFGLDFTNHLWLIWQQGQAISNTGHPTLYLQQAPGVIFEPFYGFYGGTLYAIAGTASAILGNHAYPVYVVSYFVAAAMAYGGMWWLGRQLGLSRWVAHLPAFVVVTSAYYLSDAYARGAWPELLALSAVPLFVAGGARLLTGPWRAGPVALFVIGTVILTGSHNITLFWSAVVIGPVVVLVWLLAGASRPSLKSVGAIVLLTAVTVGINGWFLLLDLVHSGDTVVGHSSSLDWAFTSYYDKLGVVLDPLRNTPAQSGTFNLTIAAPVAAFALSLILVAFSWPSVKRMGRWWVGLWLILVAALVVLVAMMVMPASGWETLGNPFILIQFPYRLAGWVVVGVAVLLAVSLRFARGLRGRVRWVAIGLALAFTGLTVVQAAAEMYPSARVDKKIWEEVIPRISAFAQGPTTPPVTWYDPGVYGDASLPIAKYEEGREVLLPIPSPGQTRLSATVGPFEGRAPVITNIAGGPYVAKVEGIRVLGRTVHGTIVVKPPKHESKPARLTVVADAGALETFGSVLSIVCIVLVLALIVLLAVRRPARFWRRRSTAVEPAS